LQGKGGDGFSDVARVVINSTLGLGGLIDIGTEAGFQKHKEDFGQTLGRWGVKPGPYVVLPLLGPSTLRDTVALPLDFKGDLWLYVDPVRLRNSGTVVRLLDRRAALLDAGNLIEDAALDPYQFVRDAYLQRRESQVHDGEMSNDQQDDESSGNPNDAAVNKEESRDTTNNAPEKDK
jgi:phospholipid-binding lipoprotein MlaA